MNKQGGITFALDKPLREEKSGEGGEPSPRGLFQTVESFVKTTHQGRFGRINKARRLFHINLILKLTLKKCITNIQLFDGPMVIES